MLPVIPFNGPWTLIVVVMAAGGVATHFALRNRSFAVKRAWLLALGCLTLACSIAFHVAYIVSPPPCGFPLLQNLPLHLCTIMSWAMPLVAWFDWRPLRAVAFYPGAVAGLATLVSAAPWEQGHSLFDVKTCFWVAHALNAIVPFLLVSLGLYRPTARQVPASIGWVVVVGLVVILPVTLALRAWFDPAANYFYLFDPEGADILVLLWEWIRVPILYVLPLLVLVLPVCYLEWGVYRLLTWRSRPFVPVATA